MNRLVQLVVSGLFLCLLVSCSGASSPVDPGIDGNTQLTESRIAECEATSSYLWGFWDVYADPSTAEVDIVPIRGALFTANVTKFIDGPPSNLIINVVDVEPVGDYLLIETDIGIRHPFPGLDKYTGFDVIGIFLGNGADSYPGDEPFAIAGENDQKLLNPDGYTRWFNAPEFDGTGQTEPMFGYIPGAFGTPDYFPSAELNAYKYYGDGLAKKGDAFDFLESHADDRGAFRPGVVAYRRYSMRFTSISNVQFQYAVVGHWEDSGITDPGIDDFPPESNSDECLVMEIVDESTLYFQDDDNFGGNVRLELTPWDWSAVPSTTMEEYSINLYSDGWTGAKAVDMEPVKLDEFNYTYEVLFPVENLTSSDPLPVWIEVSYPDFDYSNPFGIQNNADGNLAGYFLQEIQVADEILPEFEVTVPNGGEMWAPYTGHFIKWNSNYVSGNVLIQYSKDDFTTDVNTIAADEGNTGSYWWEFVPEDPSETVKVRVSSILDFDIFDDSDDYFAILEPGEPWIHVKSPIGGEEWQVGTKEWILWDSNMVTGTVLIEYSKDDFVSDINTVASDQLNDGNYLWDTVPNDISDTVKVRISSTDDPSVYNLSDDYFSISQPGAPWIDLIVPDGGQTWVIGTDHEIIWESYNVLGEMKLEYSKDSFFADINLIEDNVPDTGNYLWQNIPNDPSDTVKVRVSVSQIPSTYDESVDDFSIISPLLPWIEVQTPNGGEQWGVGTAHEVLWDSGNFTGDVKIEYSKDDFVSDINEITAWTSNTGAYVWSPIPNDLSDECRIRITSVDYPAVSDISDQDFSIVAGGAGWTRAWGWLHNDYSNALATDSDGNIYVTGNFEGGPIDFDPGGNEALRTSNGIADVFVSKFDPEGNFVWVYTFGGDHGSWRDTGNTIAVDSLGNVYVGGIFYNDCDFDPNGSGDIHSTNGQGDCYILKLDNDGGFEWARTFGGTYHDLTSKLDVDFEGNVFAAGYYRGNNVDFDPDPVDEYLMSSYYWYYIDLWILKLDVSGDFQWAGGLGDYYPYDSITSVRVDSNENVLIAGQSYVTSGQFDLDPTTGTDYHTCSPWNYEAFLINMETDGDYNWGYGLGSSGVDSIADLQIDAFGNIYLAGHFEFDVDFDFGAGINKLTSVWYKDCFVSKYDPDLNFLWAGSWGGTNQDYVEEITVNSGGDIYLEFYINGTGIDVDPGPGEYLLGTGRYLSELDTNGNLDWVHQTTPNPGEVRVGSDGNLYHTGIYTGNPDFAPGPLTDYHPSQGGTDVYLQKLGPDGFY